MFLSVDVSLHCCFSLHSSYNFLVQFFYNFEAVRPTTVSFLVAALKITRKLISKIIKKCCAMFLSVDVPLH